MMGGERRKQFKRRKRELPPMTGPSGQRFGMTITEYIVGDWCPSPDGSGPAEAVAIQLMTTNTNVSFFWRLKSKAAVEELIDALERHKKSVFE